MSDEFVSRSDLPGRPSSPWTDRTDADRHSPLETDLAVDVAVVGAGIVGLSVATHLRERGRTVAVCERRRVGAGTTGRSTAKLTSQHGLVYDHLRRRFGRRAAKTYAQVNEHAIDEVERRIEEWGTDCGFERQPSYLYGDDVDAIEREADAARLAGIDASLVRSTPPFERASMAVRFDDQAWFDPVAYLQVLADDLAADKGARLYERTRVTGVDTGSLVDFGTRSDQTGRSESEDGTANQNGGANQEGRSSSQEVSARHRDEYPCRVFTPGGTVLAEHVVLATGFPIRDRIGYFTRLYPKRSYVLALRLDGNYPEGMYYRTGDPHRSVRTHRDERGDLLLVGGENHKTGQGGSTAERYRTLERWARDRFPVDSVEYRWSAQDYTSVDRVPLVGRAEPGSPLYVATGFGGWGMTGGVAAGRLLAEAIVGEPSEFDLFDPLRFTPTASLESALTENADAAGQFATDWLRTLLSPDLDSIGRGEGRVIRDGAKPIAAARDDEGDLHTVSAVCTHTYCVVDWNDAECTWDCPCHGSRFAPDGTLLEGPATEDLPSADGE